MSFFSQRVIFFMFFFNKNPKKTFLKLAIHIIPVTLETDPCLLTLCRFRRKGRKRLLVHGRVCCMRPASAEESGSGKPRNGKKRCRICRDEADLADMESKRDGIFC